MRHCTLVWARSMSGNSHWLTYDRSDTGMPVFLPFRMSCYVLSNLVVTAGMLTPGLKVSTSAYATYEQRTDNTDNRNRPLANR